MPRYPYLLADVFTTKPFSGNPLAVFPEGEKVPAEIMLPISRELNLSETVFVLPPEDPRHAARLRIFTPGGELPFAGHPTVGTACLLAATGRVRGPHIVLEEGVGAVAVALSMQEGLPHAAFQVPLDPEGSPGFLPRDALAEILSLPVTAIGWPEGEGELAAEPGLWSCGVPFTVVPLSDPDALHRTRVDLASWHRTMAGGRAPHLFVVCRDEAEEGVFHARMFAPALGVPEDPATGAAAAAFAGFLGALRPEGRGAHRWLVHQGVQMGRPSVIELEADLRDGVARRVRVGGSTHPMGQGVVELPDPTG